MRQAEMGHPTTAAIFDGRLEERHPLPRSATTRHSGGGIALTIGPPNARFPCLAIPVYMGSSPDRTVARLPR